MRAGGKIGHTPLGDYASGKENAHAIVRICERGKRECMRPRVTCASRASLWRLLASACWAAWRWRYLTGVLQYSDQKIYFQIICKGARVPRDNTELFLRAWLAWVARVWTATRTRVTLNLFGSETAAAGRAACAGDVVCRL